MISPDRPVFSPLRDAYVLLLRCAFRRRPAQTKRLQKKGMKQAFTNERKVVVNALANPEAPQNRSIFSYS